jgi:hypothetical protein
MSSIAGCPIFTLNPLFKVPGKMFSPPCLLMGVFVLLYGRAHILKASMGINAIFITFTATLLFHYIFLHESMVVNAWAHATLIFILLVLGCTGSYYITKLKPKIGIIMIASWNGIIVWNLVCTAAQNEYIWLQHIGSVLVAGMALY